MTQVTETENKPTPPQFDTIIEDPKFNRFALQEGAIAPKLTKLLGMLEIAYNEKGTPMDSKQGYENYIKFSERTITKEEVDRQAVTRFFEHLKENGENAVTAFLTLFRKNSRELLQKDITRSDSIFPHGFRATQQEKRLVYILDIATLWSDPLKTDVLVQAIDIEKVKTGNVIHHFRTSTLAENQQDNASGSEAIKDLEVYQELRRRLTGEKNGPKLTPPPTPSNT